MLKSMSTDVNKSDCKNKGSCGCAIDEPIGKRDFIIMTAGVAACAGLATAAWPIIKTLSPSADVLAQATVEVNLSEIKEGQSIKVKWQGKPVFIRRRTKKDIDEAKAANLSNMKDPQTDEQRTIPGKEEWLIMIGVCTHLGCIPIEQDDNAGGGWFCPCHGSYYDTAGRILRGPAPYNLAIPDYYFASDEVVVIGKKG